MVATQPQQNHLFNPIEDFLRQSQPLLLVLSENDKAPMALLKDLPAAVLSFREIILLPGTNHLTVNHLAEYLASQGQLPLLKNASSQEQLDHLLYQYEQMKKSFIIVINQADQLPLATLAAIIHLIRQSQRKNICLPWILIGQAHLQTIFSQLQNKIIPVIHLPSPTPLAASTLLSTTSVRHPIPAVSKSPRHRVKTVALMGLLLVGVLLWFHKKHARFPLIESIPSNQLSATNQPVAPTMPIKIIAKAPVPAPLPLKPAVAAKPKPLATPLPRTPTYVLQLMASHDRISLQRLQQQYHLIDQTSIVMTSSKGKSWYTLVFGHFTSRKQAKQAQLALTPPLKKLQPWIKKL